MNETNKPKTAAAAEAATTTAKAKPATSKRGAAKKRGTAKRLAAHRQPSKKAQAAPRGAIGEMIRKLIERDKSLTKSNDDIAQAVKARFPKAHTSDKTVAWYRSDMNRNG